MKDAWDSFRAAPKWVRITIYVVLGLAVLVVIGTLAGSEEQGSEQVSRETTEEESGGETAKAPSPREQLRAIVEDVGPGDEIRKIVFENQGGGKLGVFVDFDGGESLTGGLTTKGIEVDSRETYEAIYTSDVANRINIVVLDAFLPLIDQRGNVSQESVYQTALRRQDARRTNWENAEIVDFDGLVDIVFKHPAIQ